MLLLDGNATSAAIRTEIAEEVSKLKSQGKKVPHLAAILVGEDGASQTYVNAKVKACENVGFESTLVRMPAETSEEELLSTIKGLNENPNIDGFIVQLPLPKHIDEDKVTLAVAPQKDVDGFHPENVGRMSLGLPTFLPATPNGVMEMLGRYNIETVGKNCAFLDFGIS